MGARGLMGSHGRRSMGARRLLIAVALAAALAHAGDAAALPAESLSGATRYETAVAVSRASYPVTAPAAIVVGGDAWPDALGGSALAGVVDAPILLSEKDRLPAPVAAELARLRPARVFVLGGGASVSPAVESAIRSSLPGAQVVRIGGADRYQVADAVAARVRAERGSAPARAFVVTGRVFSDALSCSAAAAANGWPILLANPSDTQAAGRSLRASGASKAVVVGGTASVSAAVKGELEKVVGAGSVERLAGNDRFAVAVTVARWCEANAGLSVDAPVIASGVVHADALAAGPMAAKRDTVLLLAQATGLPDVVAEEVFARRTSLQSFAFVGGTRTLPNGVRAEAQYALRARPFSAANAMAHVQALTGFGVRTAGTWAESRAADYVARQLRAYGYAVTIQNVPIPEGRTSHNVIAELPGTAPGVLVLGAHMDSKYPSPGGNDNGSGVAVTLELARCLADAEGRVPTIRFVAFGAEEISGDTSDDHHFGSRHYVGSLSAAQLSAIQGMVSIDMVGYGSVFNIRNLAVAPGTVVSSMRSFGSGFGEPLAYLKDPSRTGWSDHEAFEFRGVPVAWLEWRDDPDYHTRGDNYGHVSADRIRRTGRLTRAWLLDTTPAELDALR